ncbi:hypothetical protein OPT61_g6502 [Boeremia exigua]|uniref:Uncharacterized protein n=1 Tax=Boeremia exigua TaxID=749465 RepID=A0ACC2I6E2_9PLEO|nr:hypothetical protein OPT61_g6502 [Boeremia exigua]
MLLLSFLSLAAALTSGTAAEAVRPPFPDLKYDHTADWYKGHGLPIPEVASDITVIETNKSYVVKLECPDCPFFVRDGAKYAWVKRDNAMLLKFDVETAESALSTIRLNGAQILPLAPMPHFINAYQAAANLSREATDSLVQGRVLDGFATQKHYRQLPLQYEHTLLKTEKHGQWWLQFDITGLQYGQDGEAVHFGEDRRIVEILVKEQKGHEAGRSLHIKDLRITERHLRVQPIKMKCGRPAMVKTSFDPSQWDKYGKLGSWSRMWYKMFGKIGEYWLENIHHALLLPLALLFAFVVFFVRVWFQRRQQDKATDAEYALLDTEEDDLPAYTDIPVIKIEEYE